MAVPQSVLQWSNLATQYGNQYGVDPALILAVINQESGGDPNALSSTGAKGLMQLEPATASAMGVVNAFDPAESIRGGTQFLAQLIAAANGNITTALGHYYGSGTDILPAAGDGRPQGTYPSQVLYIYNQLKGKISGIVSGISAEILALLKKVYSASITQPFGPTSLGLEPPYEGYAHFHQGIDLGIASGTTLPSLTDGTVTNVINNCTISSGQSCGNGLGNHVVITFDNGKTITYGHMQVVSVTSGEKIGVGSTLGLTNNTGASTGAHVHIQITDPSKVTDSNPLGLIDPLPYIQAAINGTITGSGSNVDLSLPGDILNGAKDWVSGLLGGISDVPSAVESIVKVILNGFSYLTDPDKRPVLLFIVLGGFITLSALHAIITGSSKFPAIKRVGEAAAFA